MEFIMPSSVITVITALLLGVAVIGRIISDIKDVRRSRNLYNTLLSIGKKHSLKPVSVIIELRETADAILPLVSHLYNQKYPKLQVIVVVKYTAGRNAIPKLERCRRKHKLKNFRIIKHTRGLLIKDIVRRYASGALIVSLSKNERVSRNFFSLLSLDMLMTGDKANISFKRYATVDNSLASGFRAIYYFWSEIFTKRQLSLEMNIPQPGVAYLRKNFTHKPIQKYVHASSNANVRLFEKAPPLDLYFREAIKNASNNLVVYTVIFGSILLVVSTLTIANVMYPYDSWLLMLIIFFIYAFTSITVYARTRAYSSIEILNLFLLQPFSLVYIFCAYGAAIWKELLQTRFRAAVK